MFLTSPLHPRQDTIRFQTILPTLLTRPTLRKEGGEFWKIKLVPPVLKSFGNSNRKHNREPKHMERNVLPHKNMWEKSIAARRPLDVYTVYREPSYKKRRDQSQRINSSLSCAAEFQNCTIFLTMFQKNRKIAIILMIFNMLFMLLFTSGYMFYCERMRGSRPLNGTCYFWEMYLQAKVTFYK